MTGGRALARVAVLAVVAILGIVGMLLAEGGWDGVFFAMAALPLAVGSWCWWRFRAPHQPRERR